MMSNEDILRDRVAIYSKITGPRVGDYLLHKGKYVRFSHDWGESLQTSVNGSFYFSKGHIQFSGGLNRGIKKAEIVQSGEIRDGDIWFFDQDWPGAGRGVHFVAPFRVFTPINANELIDYDIFGANICPECKIELLDINMCTFKHYCKCGYIEPSH